MISKIRQILFTILLLTLIITGITFRFNWINWSQGANLHPDEYGLTNTLTQLKVPMSLGEYFNTRLSPLSPYPKYDLQGQKLADGPDNRMRWGQFPIILLRLAGEITGNTGYNEIRLMGRALSALVDSFSLLLIFLTGRRLYNAVTGLLAAALSALAVMQIQQAHFMTVDNYATLFAALAMYAAVRIAQAPAAKRPELSAQPYRVSRQAWWWYALIGAAFGMALASKINLLPLGGMILLAAFLGAVDLKLRRPADLGRIGLILVMHLALAGLVALLTFRVTHPMSFRASQGDTSFLTWQLNPDWTESMQVAARESSGVGGGPPAEQWAARPAILFPLMNMVVWGLGLPLGAAAWAGFGYAAWRAFRRGDGWRVHLLPLVWTGGYFLFMGTRWVKSVRYFLPIYPFLCLLAAWALLAWWERGRKMAMKRVLAGLTLVTVLGGTLAWAVSFTEAVYRTPHTRVQATRWILTNIPAPVNLGLNTSHGRISQPVGALDKTWITQKRPLAAGFVAKEDCNLEEVWLAHVQLPVDEQKQVRLVVKIAADPDGFETIDQAEMVINGESGQLLSGAARGTFTGAQLKARQTYFVIAGVEDPSVVVELRRTVIANENWDEGLPFPFDGYNPYGDLYRGVTNEVRWYDTLEKRQMFLDVLKQVDYIILPSQRAIWSAPRLPLTYPMTLEYYRALFDGRLGFDLVAQFDSPWQLGALQISDIGGTAAWNQEPALPLFNLNFFAAEEAFSVYDHPPVWIFRKRADFNIEQVQAILGALDLSQVVVQSPRDSRPLQEK